MGIFDFLKKPKAEIPKTGMDLPPVPTMEGIGGFPELPKEETPKLPEEALPPLPQMTPEDSKTAPEADMPPLPAAPGEYFGEMPKPPASSLHGMPEPPVNVKESPKAPAPSTQAVSRISLYP